MLSMKINLLPLVFIFSTIGCLPVNYHFKENPIFILKEAMDSMEKRDSEQFLRISGKEALCLYANDSGLRTLSENFPYSEDDINLEYNLLSAQYNEPVKFVGYWSYKSERHLFTVSEKRDEKKIMDIVIDCEYGNEGEKFQVKDQKNDRKYIVKKCRLTKIAPTAFKSPELPKKCESLRVQL